MKYRDLLEFCALMQETEANEGTLADYHVKPDGYIAQAWARVLVAIRSSEDFDHRKYLQELIDQVIEALPPDKNRLN
jgi:hypothetical protein